MFTKGAWPFCVQSWMRFLFLFFTTAGSPRRTLGSEGKNPKTDAPLGAPTIVARRKSRLESFVGEIRIYILNSP